MASLVVLTKKASITLRGNRAPSARSGLAATASSTNASIEAAQTSLCVFRWSCRHLIFSMLAKGAALREGPSCQAARAGAVYARAIAVLLHVQLRFGVLALAGVVLAVMLGSAVFSTFSLIVACLVKSRERFMGIGQVLTMPLFFASNAIYPLSLMPSWLQLVARVNPLSYVVDLLRGYLVDGNVSNAPLAWAVLLIAVLIVQSIASLTYQTIV